MEQPTKATEESPGVESAGRIIAMRGATVGIVLTLGGFLLAVLEVILSRPTTSGLAICGIGAGMYTSSAISKAWAKQSEAKVDVAEAAAPAAEGGA